MTRFYGVVGYGETEKVEDSPGKWTDDVTEFTYFGDVIRDTRQRKDDDKVNSDIVVQNQISIVADAHALANFMAIRYVMWEGVRWTVPTVEVQHPRLILSIGEVYNGQLPDPGGPD